MNVKNNYHSHMLYSRAQKLMPGGVSSPVRAFKAVSGEPRFIEHGQGSRLFDVDGNQYIDYALSFGPLILGHAHPEVVRKLGEALQRGTSFGAPTALEVELAELILSAIPMIEKIRFVNSGTEATMSALRLARAFTKRDLVVKFDGCYHGHADMLLVQAGSGVATLGLPDSPGVPAGATANTISVAYNDIDAVKRVFSENTGKIAAVIVEPVAGNMGVVTPQPGFLMGLREITQQNDALLLFDEIITGFRLGFGAVQSQFGIEPDLICLGKIIGGGLPVGAYGGRAEIMSMIAPEGPVYQAGTLAGNPLAMAAGLATLRTLRDASYERLDELADQLASGLLARAGQAGIEIRIHRVGSMLTPFFSNNEPTNYAEARGADTRRYAAFFHLMLERGIYLPPSQFEAWFASFAHSSTDIDQTLAAAETAFAALS